MMNLGDYSTVSLLTTGSQATIYKGINIYSKNPVVIKIFNINKKSIAELADICEEVDIMKKLSSHYVPKFYADETRTLGPTTYRAIIMEDLTDWITLDNYLSKKKRTKTKDFYKLLVNLISGLNYIHSNDIIHRDIKPENILIDKNFNIKYIDFGLSRPNAFNNAKGTPLYLPPETSKSGNGGVTHDIWSLGVVLYQVANPVKYPDNFPFNFSADWCLTTFIDNLRKNPYVHKSEYLYEYGYNGIDFNKIIGLMLEKNPKLRLNTNQLLLEIIK